MIEFKNKKEKKTRKDLEVLVRKNKGVVNNGILKY